MPVTDVVNYPQTLALDFDGVLCDGLREYFLTSWRAYRLTWPTSTATPPEHLPEIFYRLRAVVAAGWEMPMLLRALLKGFSELEILQHWPVVRTRIVDEEDLSPRALGLRVDAIRDQWIAEDLEEWLSLHRFYPGVVQQLQRWRAAELSVVIITTKESRFVQKLLSQAGIGLERDRIFGKDRQLPKTETLRRLQKNGIPTPIWFVEDLLPSLEKVKAESDLQSVGLFLANWGYNTPRDRQIAAQDDRIRLLSLEQFAQNFSGW
jgi:phosphoglycolate phosphatase-like HAD superfamily hydrolase